MDITNQNRLTRLLIVLFFSITLLSCGGGDEDPPIDTNVEKYLSDSIKQGQGMYGQATFIDDFATKRRQYSTGFAVQAFYNAPTKDPRDGIIPIFTVFTDSQGFFEAYMDVGQYCICTKTRQCIGITVEQGNLIRLNNEFNQAPTWSYSLNKNIQKVCQ